jgi:acyl-CoA-binding protein
MRLRELSMRNHAVSTLDILSRAMIPPGARRNGRQGVAMILGGQPEEESMSDLSTRFEQAVAESKTLPERPDNMTLLKLYALYKQASAGDVEGKRPGFTDMVGRAKWDAWNELKGTGRDDAMQQYIALVEDLKG